MSQEQEFWHELVSCGIGGKTVEEAKRNMSYSEFLDWCKYREHWGSLNIGMRIDRAVARFIYYRFGKSSLAIKNFSPYDKLADDRKVLESPEDFFQKLQGIARKS